MGIEERLNALERQNLRLKRLGLVGIAVAAAVVLMGQAKPQEQPREIHASQLLVHGHDGRIKIALGPDSKGTPRLLISDKLGVRSIVLDVNGLHKPMDEPRLAQIAEKRCKQYYDAAKLWRLMRKRYPTSLEEMEAPLRPGEDPYLKIVLDPWKNAFWLEANDGGIRVCSAGPDGARGTDDDVCYPEPKGK